MSDIPVVRVLDYPFKNFRFSINVTDISQLVIVRSAQSFIPPEVSEKSNRIARELRVKVMCLLLGFRN